MTVRCAMCGRPITLAAGRVFAGPVGPTCAKRAGLAKPRRARRTEGATRRRINRTKQAPSAQQLSFLDLLDQPA